jgi:hypothetical protein
MARPRVLKLWPQDRSRIRRYVILAKNDRTKLGAALGTAAATASL